MKLLKEGKFCRVASEGVVVNLNLSSFDLVFSNALVIKNTIF